MAQGVYSHRFHKVCFPRIAVSDDERAREMRTDETFRRRVQPQHHHGRSILEDLPIDMVETFPIADAMHLFDLGIMKR